MSAITKTRSGSRSGSGNRNHMKPSNDSNGVDLKEQPVKNRQASDNETDFHICLLCDKKCTEQSDCLFQCDRCDGWACTGCLNMPPETYCAIARPDLRWFCEQCVQPALLSVKTDKAIEDKCSEFLEAVEARISNIESILAHKASIVDLKKLDKNVKSLEEKIGKLSSTQNEVETKIGEATANLASDGVKEMTEREARKNNLIVFNVPVHKCDDPEARKEADAKYFQKLCRQGLEIEAGVEYRKIVRLGKKNDDKRPMKIILNNSDQVSQILKAAKNLGSKPEFKQISIGRDRTPLEREESRALVKLKQQKQAESDRNGEKARWVIRQKNSKCLQGYTNSGYPHPGKDRME